MCPAAAAETSVDVGSDLQSSLTYCDVLVRPLAKMCVLQAKWPNGLIILVRPLVEHISILEGEMAERTSQTV